MDKEFFIRTLMEKVGSPTIHMRNMASLPPTSRIGDLIVQSGVLYIGDGVTPWVPFTTTLTNGIISINADTTAGQTITSNDGSIAITDNLLGNHDLSVNFPSPFVMSVLDTNSIDLDVTAGVLSANAKISANPGNGISIVADGLYVTAPANFITSILDTNSIDLDVTTGVLKADSKISATGGNIITINSDGLYVPAPSADFIQSVSDTNSIDLTVSGNNLTADSKISSTAGNIISINPDGLYATASTVTPSALSKTDDTNVTMTLGGSPTVALLAATSMTLGWTGTLAPSRGGTGQDSSAWAQGDIVYISATGTWNHLAKDTNATRYLSNQGTSNNPSWNQVNLANGVTGVLPPANGGTGVANNAASTITISGNFATTFTLTNTTSVTLPTSGTLATLAGTETFTNKRWTRRVLSLSANSGSPTIDTNSYDVVHITNQTAAINLSTNLSGSANDGDILRISITGTASVAITMGTSFEASSVALPTTTVGTNRLDIVAIWNTETTKWRVVTVV